MIKRITSIFMVVIIACTSVFALSASAEGSYTRVEDMADLLSDSQETALREKLDEISERQDLDVVVVTTNSLEGKSTEAYADDFYDYNGYRNDGVLLLVSTVSDSSGSYRHISTTGFGEKAFTGEGLQWIVNEILPSVKDGEYEKAFNDFADISDDFVTRAKNGKPFVPFHGAKKFLICLAIGVVLAFIVVTSMKSKLKTVHQKANASDYTRPGSMNLTASNDVFLYNHVDRTRRVKDEDRGGSGSHTSSSGSSHGGISF